MELIEAVKSKKPILEIYSYVATDLQKQDSEGRTALMHAILNNYEEAAKILIAECGVFDKYNNNAYIYASKAGMSAIVEEIEQDYMDIEVNIKRPGSELTVYQYVKTEQQQAEGFQLQIGWSNSGQDNLLQAPSGLSSMAWPTQGDTTTDENAAIHRSLLSPNQYAKLLQAEYLLKAIISGVQQRPIKDKLKQLLDRDLQIIICNEYGLSTEQLAYLVQ